MRSRPAYLKLNNGLAQEKSKDRETCLSLVFELDELDITDLPTPSALHGLMYTDRRPRGTRQWRPQMLTRMLSGILILMASSAALGQVPLGCDTKVAERTGVSGCYLVASEQLGGTRSSAFLTTMGQVPQVIFSTAKVASEEER